MPLGLYVSASFRRSIRRLGAEQRSYYEAGVESNLRVIIAREKQMCTALLAGNHDQIKRFLAEI